MPVVTMAAFPLKYKVLKYNTVQVQPDFAVSASVDEGSWDKFWDKIVVNEWVTMMFTQVIQVHVMFEANSNSNFIHYF